MKRHLISIAAVLSFLAYDALAQPADTGSSPTKTSHTKPSIKTAAGIGKWTTAQRSKAFGIWLEDALTNATSQCPVTWPRSRSPIPDSLYSNSAIMWSTITRVDASNWGSMLTPTTPFDYLYTRNDTAAPLSAPKAGVPLVELPQRISFSEATANSIEINCFDSLMAKGSSTGGFGFSAELNARLEAKRDFSAILRVGEFASNLSAIFSGSTGGQPMAWADRSPTFERLIALYQRNTSATYYYVSSLRSAQLITAQTRQQAAEAHASLDFNVGLAKGQTGVDGRSRSSLTTAAVTTLLLGNGFVPGPGGKASSVPSPDIKFGEIPSFDRIRNEVARQLDFSPVDLGTAITGSPTSGQASGSKFQFIWGARNDLAVRASYAGGGPIGLTICSLLQPVDKPFGLDVLEARGTIVGNNCIIRIALGAIGDEKFRNAELSTKLRMGFSNGSGGILTTIDKPIAITARFEYEHAAFYKSLTKCDYVGSEPLTFDCKFEVAVAGSPAPKGTATVNTRDITCLNGSVGTLPSAVQIPTGGTATVRVHPTKGSDTAKGTRCTWRGFIRFVNPGQGSQAVITEDLEMPPALLEFDTP